MNKVINYVSTLVYYDGTQVVEGLDDDGKNYIGFMFDQDAEMDYYSFMEIDNETLHQYRVNEIVIEDLFASSDPDIIRYFAAIDDYEKPIALTFYGEYLTSIEFPDDSEFF